MIDLIGHWLTSQDCRRVALVLLHTLWQAALVCLLLGFTLRWWLSARRCQVRYIACLVALGVVVIGAMATWAELDQNQRVAAAHRAIVKGDLELNAGAVSESITSELTTPPAPTQLSRDSQSTADHWPWSTYVFGAWAVGVILMLSHSARCVRSGHRLITDAAPSRDPAFTEVVDQMRRRLGIRRSVRLIISESVNVPAVLGVIWPVLLAPPAMISGMTTDQLRTILAHELAHIRRHDYLVNLIQMVLESLLFFNPAVWWISRQVRIEREACCDALAVHAVGEAGVVVRTLANVAMSLRPRSTALQAFGGPSSGRSLIDRLRRMAMPDHRPPMRVPWRSLAAVLVLCAVALLLVGHGTGVVVKATAQLLTPHERIAKLDQISQTHRRTQRDYGPEDQITISGVLRTEDGAPLPLIDHVSARSERRSYSACYGFKVVEGRFHGRVSYGQVTVHAKAPGYALSVVGPLKTAPGETIQDIEVVFRKGFTGRVRLTDPRDQPLAGATLKPWTVFGSVSLPAEDVTTDANGVATIEHCDDRAIRFDARVDGYQYEQTTITLSPDRVFPWRLQAAAATTGRVLAAASGQPVEGVQVLLIHRQGHANTTMDPRAHKRNVMSLATTDAAGRFALTTLRDDCSYAFYFKNEVFAPRIVESIRAGEKDLEVQLDPPRVIRGRILGPLEKLKQRRIDGEAVTSFTYSNPIMLGDSNSYSSHFSARVDIVDGEGRFTIKDLLPTPVRLHFPGKTVLVDPSKYDDEVVIDIRAEQEGGEPVAMRTVVLRFDLPEGAPPPRGTFRVDYIKPEYPNSYYPLTNLPIQVGQVRVEVPVPTRIRYEAARTLGYWVPQKHGIEVVPGDEPLVIQVPAEPAGAIYGRVLNASGAPAQHASATVINVQRPPSMVNRHFDPNVDHDEDSNFMITPVPLGGEYRITASDGSIESHARVMGPIVTVDEANPIHQLELRFVEGVDISVLVLDDEGRPVPAADLSLHYSAPPSHGFGGAKRQTDRLGRLRFGHVNPDLPGTHSLNVHPTAAFQGQKVPIGFDGKTITVRLRPGHSAAGVLIDDATSWPIPEAVVTAYPAENASANYHGTIETRTNHRGEFRFGNLEDIRYRLRAEGTVTPDTEIRRNADGTTTYRTRGVRHDTFVTGGQEEVTTMRVKIRPKSRLKAKQVFRNP